MIPFDVNLLPEFRGGPFVGDVQSVNGLNLPFWALITAFDSSTGFYSWVEVQLLETSGVPSYFQTEGLRHGSLTVNPAYDPNSNPVTLNSVVLLRRAYYDKDGTGEWVYAVVAFGGPFDNVTINQSGNTYNYTSDTFNYFSSNTFRVENGGSINYTATGTGYYVYNAPLEICGFLFWCCITYTFASASITDWDITAVGGKIVYDITANSGGTTLHSIIVPQIAGANGPVLVVLRNVSTDNLNIKHNGTVNTTGKQITLPPAYGTNQVTLKQYDAIGLWYDSCSQTKWGVLFCTVAASVAALTTQFSKSPGSVNLDGANLNAYQSVVSIGPLDAGTYLFWGNFAAASISGSAGNDEILAQMRDTTNNVILDLTADTSVCWTDVAAVTARGSFSVGTQYQSNNSFSVAVEAKCASMGTPTATASNGYIACLKVA